MEPRRRTCDRCYRIKVRCNVEGESKACTRCIRLGHHCETRRPYVRPGPRASQAIVQARRTRDVDRLLISGLAINDQSVPGTLDPFRHAISAFDANETILLDFMLDKNAFISRYVDGPYFQEGLRGMLVRQLVMHPHLLKDGYLSCVGHVHQTQFPMLAIEAREKTIQRSAIALRTLSNIRAESALEVSAMLTLAMALITSSTQLTGLSSHPITQAALQLAKPWCEGHGRDQIIHDSNFICMVFHDTIDCLIQRAIPTLRLQCAGVTLFPDRYLGICASLQPILYDLCRIGMIFKGNGPNALTTSDGRVMIGEVRHGLTDIWRAVDRWKPDPVPSAHSIFTPSHMQLMQTQASCFQLATKLMVLEYGSLLESAGSQFTAPVLDEDARSIARHIMTHLDVFAEQPTSCRRYVIFPYFIAALILGARSEETIYTGKMSPDYETYRNELRDRLQLYSNGTSDAHCERLIEFASQVWNTQERRGRHVSWLPLVDQVPPISMGI